MRYVHRLITENGDRHQANSRTEEKRVFLETTLHQVQHIPSIINILVDRSGEDNIESLIILRTRHIFLYWCHYHHCVISNDYDRNVMGRTKIQPATHDSHRPQDRPKRVAAAIHKKQVRYAQNFWWGLRRKINTEFVSVERRHIRWRWGNLSTVEFGKRLPLKVADIVPDVRVGWVAIIWIILNLKDVYSLYE